MMGPCQLGDSGSGDKTRGPIIHVYFGVPFLLMWYGHHTQFFCFFFGGTLSLSLKHQHKHTLYIMDYEVFIYFDNVPNHSNLFDQSRLFAKFHVGLFMLWLYQKMVYYKHGLHLGTRKHGPAWALFPPV
nr:hypothetical protein Iba_chr11dCG7050 [Ipomoea batatas]